MKFLALKDALDKSGYEKICVNPTLEKNTIPLQSSPPPFHMGKSEVSRVAGGVILWKPVNRQAAMMLAKAPWWAMPPQSSKPNQEPKPKPKPMSFGIKHANHRNQFHVDGQEERETKSNDQFNAELISKFNKKMETTMDKSEELVDRAQDARAAMQTLTETFQKDWIDFMDTADTRLKELRMSRMAVDTEMRQLMASLREVRQFFLDKDYESERARLLEFVGICERLKAIKDSGFLDTVADTMLHLSVKKT